MSSKAAPERALRAYLLPRPLKSCVEGPIRGCDGGWAVSLPPDRPQAPKTAPARPFWFGLGSGLDSRARLDSKHEFRRLPLLQLTAAALMAALMAALPIALPCQALPCQAL